MKGPVDEAARIAERDALTSAIATKQAILSDLERRTSALAELKEQVLRDTAAAQRRLESLEAELGQLLATLPALPAQLAEIAHKVVADALESRIDAAVRRTLKRQLVPALRAALASLAEAER